MEATKDILVYHSLLDQDDKLYEMTITVDQNDADCLSRTEEITLDKLLGLLPIIDAIKNFKPYKVNAQDMEWEHNSNWPKGECLREDLGEKSPDKIYPTFSSSYIEEFEENWLPLNYEYGFHTIVSIDIVPVGKRIKLL